MSINIEATKVSIKLSGIAFTGTVDRIGPVVTTVRETGCGPAMVTTRELLEWNPELAESLAFTVRCGYCGDAHDASLTEPVYGGGDAQGYGPVFGVHCEREGVHFGVLNETNSRIAG